MEKFEFNEQFYADMEKYFCMSQSETAALYKKKFHSDVDLNKFQTIFQTLKPYLKPFVSSSDEKLKHKVGLVLLSKLDYGQIEENSDQLHARLDRLFNQISSKGINVYKTVYCSVVIDGNLKRDVRNNKRYYDPYRDFDDIYNAVKSTLNLAKNETNEIFERCSSLISKSYSNLIPMVLETLTNFYVMDGMGCQYALYPKEAQEILKINPSLFNVLPLNIQYAYNFLQNKMAPRWEAEALVEMRKNSNMDVISYKVIQTRKCLKNNSSLLALSVNSMVKKEKFISDLNLLTENDYSDEFDKIFNSLDGISTISQIPEEKIKRNAFRNIKNLEKYVSKEDVRAYLSKNLYMLGMDFKSFGTLLSEINRNCPENFEKFLKFDKTLFASNIDFDVDSIFEKLKNGAVMIDIDVNKFSDRECLQKFVEIFFDGNLEIFDHIEKLIAAKKKRDESGEKELRRQIRKLGKRVEDLPYLLTIENVSTNRKKDDILQLCQQIGFVNQMRFMLCNTDDPFLVQKREKQNGKLIEKDLNTLRETFEQRRFKLGKKYSNLDILFERTMNFLSETFDDKEPLTYLFKNTILDKFNETMKDYFSEKPQTQQIQIFKDNFGEPTNIKIPNPTLKNALEKLNKEINRIDQSSNFETLEFNA